MHVNGTSVSVYIYIYIYIYIFIYICIYIYMPPKTFLAQYWFKLGSSLAHTSPPIDSDLLRHSFAYVYAAFVIGFCFLSGFLLCLISA